MYLKRIFLRNILGFEHFTVELTGDLTVFVGLNSKGKTNILRSVKMALEAFAMVFGSDPDPKIQLLDTPGGRWPTAPINHVAQRAGIYNWDQIFFKQNQEVPALITLVFSGADNVELPLTAVFRPGGVQCVLSASPDVTVDKPSMASIVKQLHGTKAEFFPPPASLCPPETAMPWHNLEQLRGLGKFFETWRNHLHWLSEDADPESFHRIVARVRDYLGDVQIRPPRRSRQGQTVELTYMEDGVEYDISASGAGLRTLITLAAAVELSKARLLLFDEPDAHLHSSLQRQVATFLGERAAQEKQILVTTHAPDFVEEAPLESLIWIDRTLDGGRRCDDVGKALVELGATSHARAIEELGADALLCFEAMPDRRIFSTLMIRCGMENFVNRCRLETLGGFGDAIHLAAGIRVLKRVSSMTVAAAAILDADYTKPLQGATSEEIDGVLVVRLPCKELENLLLLSPTAIANAARKEADRRAVFTGQRQASPEQSQVNKAIEQYTRAVDVLDALRPQWMSRRLADNLGPGQFAEAEKEFAAHLEDPLWRARSCPGKKVLSHLRRWLQDQFNLSIGLIQLFESYEPDSDLVAVFQTLKDHIDSNTS